MLDAGVRRVRADRLAQYIEGKKQEAAAVRVTAVDQGLQRVAYEKTGEITAYDEIQQYLDVLLGDDELMMLPTGSDQDRGIAEE